MPAKEEKTFQVNDAELIYLNFSGRPTPFNKDGGVRTFGVILPPELAVQLDADGWNVKTVTSKDEDLPDRPFIAITIDFDYFKPPRVTVISSTGRTNFDEEDLALLDSANIRMVDLIVRGYDYHIKSTGLEGTKAYLKTMFITIDEDELEKKYAGIEKSG